MGYPAALRDDPRSTTVGRYLETLRLLGHHPRNEMRILDLGCGAGATVYEWKDAGYDALGFDIKDYLRLRSPVGHLIGHYWWFYFWALLGIRNRFQKGLSADETARRNCVYLVEGLNYLPNSIYSVLWADCGLESRWFDNENLRAGPRPLNRFLGHIDRFVPAMSFTLRNFLMRRVCLKKPSSSVPTGNVS
jgi:hypothetical protein